MSHIPKYILKRLIPTNAVKLEDDKLSVDAVNIISPIPISELPGSPRDVLTIELDGKTVFSPEKQELADEVSIEIEGEKYNIDNIKQACGGTIPIGMKIHCEMPNIFGFAAGEKHKMKVNIEIDSPMEIEMERKIN